VKGIPVCGKPFPFAGDRRNAGLWSVHVVCGRFLSRGRMHRRQRMF
jgi:hypothetical protein